MQTEPKFLRPAILTDIEGTTSSISFVKDVLFPYARRALPRFVRDHGRDPKVRRWLDAVAVANGCVCDDAMIAEVLQGWIDEDRKHTALKALQGLIWARGYRNGAFSAHVYRDAVEALKRWHEAGPALAVYSSGSVDAQKLFFKYSDAGDLTPLFSNYFDTQMGHKREANSYRRIADSLNRRPEDISFLSDVAEEFDAAREASMRTMLIDRRDDYPRARCGDEIHGHARSESFAGISI
ncbi:MAG: acireductone synthase [Gammaproteobacteria bacterium]